MEIYILIWKNNKLLSKFIIYNIFKDKKMLLKSFVKNACKLGARKSWHRLGETKWKKTSSFFTFPFRERLIFWASSDRKGSE